METKASHIVVGTFVLVVIAGLFGFVIWLARVEIDRSFAYYHIFFDEAVSGLSLGGDVRYNGIPVGTVTAIEIDPADPSRVRVTAEIGQATKVRQDTVAKLELQGITGVSFIQLTGGSFDAPELKPGPDGEPAVIKSQRSAITEIFAGAPDLINRLIGLVEQFTAMVSDENVAAAGNVLRNIDDLSGRLARRGPELEKLIVDLTAMSAELRSVTAEMDDVLRRANGVIESADATLATARGTISAIDDVVENDARRAVREFEAASRSFRAVGDSLNGLMAENGEALTAFSNDGLVEFTRFIEEARLLVSSASRLVENLESDPAQFLFGDQQSGFEAQ